MIKVYFDGACEPKNPGGTASFGVVILKGKKRIYEASDIFKPVKGKEKETSNNVAEYSGFLDALEWLVENGCQDKEIEIFGDSKLVIEQMFGSWAMRKGFYIPIAKKAKSILKKFKNITGTWIPREENSIADELSKGALVKAGIKLRIQPQDKVPFGVALNSAKKGKPVNILLGGNKNLLTDLLNTDIEEFLKLGKNREIDCGNGISMKFVEFAEQDVKTFIVRIKKLMEVIK
jgi:ribonuclease HI